MAITRYAGDRFVVDTGDTKPTGVLDGAFLVDTGNLASWILTPTGWSPLAGGGGGGGSTSPGGSNTQVQFNNAGSFAGDADLTFTNGNRLNVNKLGISGNIYDSNNYIGEGGMVLTNQGTTGVNWKSIESVLSGVGGSGVANYVAKWSDEDTLTSGTIFDNGDVGIGTANPGGKLHVFDTVISDMVILESSGPSAADGPDVVFYRNSASPADNDDLGKLVFRGRNDNSQDVNYANIIAEAIDVSDGTEDGALKFYTYLTGANTETMVLRSANVGIGTNNPGQNLQIHQADSDVNYLEFTNTTATTGTLVGLNAAEEFILWHRHDSDMVFATNAVEKMRIENGGDVGIGTNSAGGNKLYVYGGGVRVDSNGSNANGSYLNLRHANNNTTDVISTIFFSNSTGSVAKIVAETVGANNSGVISFHTENAGTSGQRMTITADGKIGIGTASPSAKLHVNSTGDQLYLYGGSINNIRFYNGWLQEFSTTGGSGITSNIYYDGSYRYRQSDVGVHLHIGNGEFDFRTSSSGTAGNVATRTQRMVITNGGLVGIGTASPSAKLHVYTSATLYQLWGNNSVVRSNTGSHGLRIYNNDSGGSSLVVQDDGGSNTTFIVKGGASGSVGIGTNNPTLPLHIYRASGNVYAKVQNGSTSQAALQLQTATTDGNWVMYIPSNSTNLRFYRGADKVTLTADGNVGIGTIDPLVPLDVRGNITLDKRTQSLGSAELAVKSNVHSSIVADRNANTNSANFMLRTAGTNKWRMSLGMAGSSNEKFSIYDEANTKNVLTVEPGGNIGIGDNLVDPEHRFHVSGDAIISGYLYDSTNSTGADGYVLTSKEDGPQWKLVEDVLSGVGGSGTANYVSKWVDSDTIGNSIIYDDGDVGISTASPDAKLHVFDTVVSDLAIFESSGPSSANAPDVVLYRSSASPADADDLGRIAFRGRNDNSQDINYANIIAEAIDVSDGTEDGALRFNTYLTGASTETMVLRSANVGIGTNNPDVKLSVRDSTADLQMRIGSLTAGRDAKIRLQGKNTANSANRFADIGLDAENGLLQFWTPKTSTPSVVAVSINSSANVGIGTDAPAAKLEVQGLDVRIAAASPTSDAHYLRLKHDNSEGIVDSNRGKLKLQSNDDIVYTLGSVGVGTDAPSRPLHVYVTSGNNYLTVQNTSTSQSALQLMTGTTDANWLMYIPSSSTDLRLYRGADKVVFKADGKVGIGTNAPDVNLHIYSASSPQFRIQDSTNNCILKAYAQDSDAFVGTHSDHSFIIGMNNTTKITVASALTTFADAIALSTNTTPSTSGGEGFLYKHGTNGTVLSGYNASIETGSAGSRSVRLAISNTGATTFNSAFTFPTADGSAGQVLQTNGSGTVTWATVSGGGGVSGSGTDHYIPRWNGTTALQDSAIIALDSGSVGIGASSPDAKLEIKGTAGSTGLTFKTTDSSSNNTFWIQDGGKAGLHYYPFVINQDNSDTDCPASTFFYVHHATAPFIIKNDGKVGIGTNAPSKIFEVYHSENRPVLIKTAGSYNSFIEMDSNRSGADSYTGGIVGKWNGTETASIYFRTGSDTTNKDDGYITFQTAPAGTISERMRITSSGLVGIGTNAPSEMLHINKSSGTGSFIRFQDTGGGGVYIGARSNVMELYAGGAERMRIASDGNVGIGTNAPAGKLESYITSGGEKGLRLNSNFSGGNAVDFIPAIVGVSNAGFSIDLAGTTRFVINDGGNVGIGTNSPARKLHVSGGSGSRSDVQVTYDALGTSANDGAQFGIQSGGAYIWNYENSSIYFGTNNGERMRITSGGNVGIGTVTPQGKLDINTEAAEATHVYINGEVNQDKLLYFRHYANSEGAGATGYVGYIGSKGNDNLLSLGHLNSSGTDVPIMHLAEDGHVGIGTTDPAYILDVYETGSNIAIFRSTATNYARVIIRAGASGDAQLSFQESTTTKWTIGNDGGDSDKFKIVVGGGAFGTSPIVAIDTAGKVGVGSNAPAFNLDVTGTGHYTGLLNLNAGLYLARESDSIYGTYIKGGSQQFPASPAAYYSLGKYVMNTASYSYNTLTGHVVVGYGNPNTNDSFAKITFTVYFRDNNSLATGAPYVTWTYNVEGKFTFQSDPPFRVSKTQDVSGGAKTYELQFSVGANYGTAHWKVCYSNVSTTNAVTIYDYAATIGTAISDGRVTRQGYQIYPGCVGIGTDAPTSPLTIKSSSTSATDSGLTIQGNSNTNAIVKIAEKSTDGARLHLYDGGVEKIAFYTDGTANHISAGSVGIGTNNPSNRLHIEGTTLSNASIRIEKTTTGINEDPGLVLAAANNTDGYRIGSIFFQGGATSYAQIRAEMNGTAGAKIYFVAGSQTNPVSNSSTKTLELEDGTITAAAAFRPLTDSSYTLGQASLKWSELYVDKIKDVNNSTGSANQILSAGGSGGSLDWISLSEISGVDGSGTANTIPRWTDSDTIGDSLITVPSNARVQINGTAASTFEVHGQNASGIVYSQIVNTVASAVGNGAGIELRGLSSTQERQLSYITSRWLDNTDASRKSRLIITTNDGGTLYNTYQAYGKDPILAADAGNVGIGTNNPQQLLHINGSSPIIRFRDSDATGTPLAHIDASGGALKLQADSSNETASSFLTLEVDGSEHVRVIADGNVGIGTNNPSCLLQVGTDGVQGGAHLAIRRNGDAINFGHVNGAGYGSVIGCSSNNGYPHIGFMCEAGTNINTFRTRGLKGNVIYTSTSGELTFAQITTATADNQSPTNRMTLNASGDLQVLMGQLQVISGAVSAPSFSFTNDPDTGMSRPTTNALNFVTGGSERVRINSGGQAGFGSGTFGSNNVLTITNVGNDASYSAIALGTATTGHGNSEGYWIGMLENGQAYLWNYENQHILFGANNTERMRINSDGNVGIGTNTPAAKLDIWGGTGARPTDPFGGQNQLFISQGGTSNAGITISADNNAGTQICTFIQSNTSASTALIGTQSDHALSIRTNNTDRITIASDGDVDIAQNLGVGGAHTGAYKFYVHGNSYLNGTAYVDDKLTVDGDIDFETMGDYITFYGDSGQNHSISSRNSSGVAADDIRINTYGALFINLDSNGNDTSETHSNFQIGRHAGTGAVSASDLLLNLSGETGKLRLYKYGSGTHTGTAAYKLSVDSSGNVIESAIGAGAVDGSGTANKVTKWTDSDTIGDSQITDNGTSVGINQGSPNAANKLEVHNGNITITSGKQLISTNAYTQVPPGMLTTQGPSTGATTLGSGTWGIMMGPQHTRSNTANTYYPGIAFNHLLNHSGASTWHNHPQAWIGTRLHDTSGSERSFLVFSTKSGTGLTSSDVPLERMCIDPVYGSVGIGATDPNSQLQVQRAQTTSAFTDAFLKLTPTSLTNTTGLTSIALATSTVDNYGYSISGWRAGTDGSPHLAIKRHNNSAAGVDVMAMDSSGHVGIGTNDPAYILDVYETGSNLGIFRSTATNYARLVIRSGSAGDAQLAFQNNTSTKWSIGNDGGDSNKFKIAVGSGAFAASEAVIVDTSGNLSILGTLTEASSLALKENIEDFTPSLDIINKIRPVKYNKKKESKKEIGLIAEELAELFPELVDRDNEGNPSGVNYSRAVTVLLGGFKELYKEIEELKKRI